MKNEADFQSRFKPTTHHEVNQMKFSKTSKIVAAAVAITLAHASHAFASTNLNTVSAADLSRITGISIEQTAKIVWYRDNVHRFQSLNDLYDVPGLKATTIEQLREDADITVDCRVERGQGR